MPLPDDGEAAAQRGNPSFVSPGHATMQGILEIGGAMADTTIKTRAFADRQGLV